MDGPRGFTHVYAFLALHPVLVFIFTPSMHEVSPPSFQIVERLPIPDDAWRITIQYLGRRDRIALSQSSYILRDITLPQVERVLVVSSGTDSARTVKRVKNLSSLHPQISKIVFDATEEFSSPSASYKRAFNAIVPHIVDKRYNRGISASQPSLSLMRFNALCSNRPSCGRWRSSASPVVPQELHFRKRRSRSWRYRWMTRNSIKPF